MSVGIRAFIGPNGSGKTFAMVAKMAAPAFAAGKPVVANFRLYPERGGYRPELYIPLRSWRDVARVGVHNLKLCEVHHVEKCNQGNEGGGCGAPEYVIPRTLPSGELWSITGNRPAVMLFDEITAMLPSRETGAVPPELVNVLMQFRKPEVQVGWSAPAWMRCDTALRANTQILTVCRGLVPDRYERDDKGKKLKGADGKAVRRPWDPWGSKRLFKWTHYDAYDFEEWSADLEDQTKIKPLARNWLWRPWFDFHRLYDTNDSVSLSDHLERVKWCRTCDLPRTKESCREKSHWVEAA